MTVRRTSRRRYARGRNSMAECQRSGQKMRYRDLVEDGHIPGLLVHPDWWEPQHPQEIPVDVTDAIALRHPAPEILTSDATDVTDMTASWSPTTLSVTLEAGDTSDETAKVSASDGTAPFEYDYEWTTQPDDEIDFVDHGDGVIAIVASEDADAGDFTGTLRATITDVLGVIATADLSVEVTIEAASGVTVASFGDAGDSFTDRYGYKDHSEITAGSIDPPGYEINGFTVVEVSYDEGSPRWSVALDDPFQSADLDTFDEITVFGAGGASKTLVVSGATTGLGQSSGITTYTFADSLNGGTTVTWTADDVGETYAFEAVW